MDILMLVSIFNILSLGMTEVQNSNQQSNKSQKLIIRKRSSDILKNNMYKYYYNLKDFNAKLLNEWKPPKTLKIPENYTKYLTPYRPCKLTKNVDLYLRGEITEDIFFSPKQSPEELEATCLFEGGIPVLTCTQPIPEKNASLCFCSIQQNDSPYVYSFNGTHCLGEYGSICNEATLPCAPELNCEDGICGGSEAWTNRAYFGQDMSYTEESYMETLHKSNDDTIKQQLYIRSGEPRIKLMCNPRIFADFLHEFIEILKKAGTVKFAEDTSSGKFLGVLDKKSAMFDVLIQESEIARTPGRFSEIGQEFDQNERCFNMFPFMSCVEVGADRGHCLCSDFSPFFSYVEKDGHCVARYGSVCTMIKGSGDFLCEGNWKCESIGETSKVPTPFSHLEFKVCGGWEAIKSKAKVLERHHHEHDMKVDVEKARTLVTSQGLKNTIPGLFWSILFSILLY